jgi:biopolymer transport protein ExbD
MRSLSRRQGTHQPVDLNVIPLIDVVFFLLIFYVISTVFAAEQAVPVQRPGHSQARTVSGAFVPVAITREGRIRIGAQAVEPAGVTAAVRSALAGQGSGTVVVIADREVPTGLLLQVMDACQAAGATRVDVAATKVGP